MGGENRRGRRLIMSALLPFSYLSRLSFSAQGLFFLLTVDVPPPFLPPPSPDARTHVEAQALPWEAKRVSVFYSPSVLNEREAPWLVT